MKFKKFLKKCKEDTSFDIYEAAQADDKLRIRIYEEGSRLLGKGRLSLMNEPFRASCEAIGIEHNISALINY